MASRIDAMLAAGALDEDDIPDDEGADEAHTGVIDPSMIEPPTGVRDVPRGIKASLDDEDLLDEVDGMVELSGDDLTAAELTPPPRPMPGDGRPMVKVPMPPSGARPPIPRIPSIPAIPPAIPPPLPTVPPPRPSRPVVHVPPVEPKRPSGSMPQLQISVDAGLDSIADAEAAEQSREARQAEVSGARALPDAPAVVAEIDEIELESDTGIHDAAPDGIPAAVDEGPSEAVVAAEIELHNQLESPTVIEKALGDLGDASHEKRAEELTRDAEAATERPAIASIHYELGELFERRLADEARAVKAFGKALSTDPSLRPNLWAIRRIFYRRGLWPNLIKLVDAEQRFARNDAERADLHLEKGLIQRDRLEQPVEARASLEEAARLDPRQLAARLALERMALADGDLDRAAVLWEQLAENARTPERKLVHLLDLIRHHADRGPAGLDRARELITDAVALGVDAERVADERLRVAEASGEADEILAALEAQAALMQNAMGPAGLPEVVTPHGRPPGTPLDRGAAVRLRLGAIRRRQAQVARGAKLGERAWDYLQRAIAVAPGEALLLADLADLAEELGRFDELAELVQSWQSLEGDPARAVTLSIRRADALLRGGQRDAARALLASLESTTPGFLPLTALAERDALGSGDWASLAAAWGRSADAARLGTLLGPGDFNRSPDGSRTGEPDLGFAASLYVAAADLWMHEAGDTSGPGPEADGEARAALGKALEVVRGHAAAIEALVELHERAGRVDDAAALLELQAESPASSDLEARIQILARLARLYRDHGYHDQALAADLRLRRLCPDDVRLMWQVDVTLAQLGGPDRPDRLVERIANLQAIASRDPDPARKGVALSTAARLAEDAGDRDRAIDLYRQVLAVWPAERYARAALVELLRAQERWEDLVAQRRAEATELAYGTHGGPDGGPGLVRALREAAWVLEERLGRPADAAVVYRELLDRVPDEPSAALGLIRCRAAAGDGLGLVAALEGRLESLITAGAGAAAIASAAVTLATAHEAAGRVDDAVDAYRRVLVYSAPEAARAGEGSAPATAIAALALADVAAARGDTPGREEAYAALAAVTGSSALAACLHEDLGWSRALILEDFDAAAVAFSAAARANPAARGPLLGGLLVAARRADLAGLAIATSALAETVTMPEAAAALHLRAAALTSALGEQAPEGTPPPAAAVARARTVAPDDVGALVVAADHLPPSTPPPAGSGAEEVAFAVDVLLARAEVFALRAQLADDPVARASWELDRAEALEAAGRLKESGEVVAGVLRAVPGEIRALEALRRLARRGGDLSTYARATVSLARRMLDPQGRIELLREAASVFDPNVGQGGPNPNRPGVDADAAVAVYRRILADDQGAPDFDRLVVLFRGAGDLRGLHQAIDERMAWLDRTEADPKASVPLLLERARLRRGMGNQRGAVGDLRELIRREPGQTEALRLAAELVGGMGDAPGAVDLWRRYLAVETAPDRRGTAELALSRVLAEQMGDAAGAILELERVIGANPDDAQLRERMIGLATRTNDWAKVARELRELARLRPTVADRAREELRLAEVQRDKLDDRAAARATLIRARQHDPFNLEIVEPLVALTDDPAQRKQLLGEVAGELRAAIEQQPTRAPFHERLFGVAGWLADRDLAYWGASAVEAVGTPTAEHRQAITDGRTAAAAALPRQILDPARRALLRPAAASGVLADVWRAIAAAVTAAQGLEPAKVGFAKADRIALKEIGRSKRFEPLAASLMMLGLDDVEIYVNDARAGMARVLSAETPIVCLGGDVASGAAAQSRYWLGRSIMLAAEHTGTLAELKDAEVAWYLAAAARVADVAVPPALAEIAAQDAAAIADRVRLLAKAISRRDRKALAAAAPQLARLASPDDVGAWRRGAMSSAHRAGLLVAGDLAPVMAALDARGARGIDDSPAAADLVSWAVSEAHLDLRRHVYSMPVAGGRR